jgi:hypothetical protein
MFEENGLYLYTKLTESGIIMYGNK